MKRTRVAHVLSALNYGGVESNALQLIGNLPAESESRVYYIGREPSQRVREFEAMGTAVTHCPYFPPNRLSFARRLARCLRQDRIEALLCYSFGNHAAVSLAGWMAGVKRRYVQVNGSPMRDATTLRKCKILAHLARPFCNGEIAVSARVREELISGVGLPARRVRVIENGCPVAEFRRRAGASRAQRTDRILTVLMVARMDDAKDQATLLRAAALLQGSGEAIRVLLAGDGPNRGYLESLARELGPAAMVEFLGERADVPELLGRSDLAVLATHTEGFGLVLIEAMAAEIPVIATDLPVTREVLDDGACGLLVRGGDPQALTDAIFRLAQDATLRRGLVARAAERAERLYDVLPMAQRYAGLLLGQEAAVEVALSPAPVEVRR